MLWNSQSTSTSIVHSSKVQKFSCAYHQAEPVIKVADRVVMRATAIVVITAGGSLKRATSPFKAIVCKLVSAAAGVAFWAGIVIITDLGRLYWRWRGWTRVGRIWTCLDRIRSFHGNSTHACGWAEQITFHPDIPILSPTSTPWIPHYPVFNTFFCPISNHSNTMVQWCTTFSSKYTLQENKKKCIRDMHFKVLGFQPKIIKNY